MIRRLTPVRVVVADGEIGDVWITTADSVTVYLGDPAANSLAQTIIFDLTTD